MNPMKKCLSKNLSQMKFMKRRSTDAQGRDEADSGGVLTEKWIIVGATPPPPRKQGVQQTDSFMDCEDLSRLGRFSYNNFNKEVERLMQQYTRTSDGSPSDVEDETEMIPAYEVARRYEEIGSKKLLGKRKRKQDDDRKAGLDRRLSEPARPATQGFMKPRQN